MSINLYFPQLNGGVEQGLNDAGIETFEGEYQQHIVRECTQNALDARFPAGGQVRIEIQLRQIPTASIPGLAALRTAIQSSRDYWRGNDKTETFCAKALSWTEGEELAVLEVADYGTKGLDGADGERNGSWFGLVQSGGVSINQDDAGGAFGIGKKAPFAGSFARTIFYSTLNRSGGRAFQGVSTLTTHLDTTGNKTQAAGFIGQTENGIACCKSVREPLNIPEPFRRTEPGTSIFIIAYRHLGADDWADAYIREAVENFWPAIHRGSLIFQIGDQRVDTTTLPALMARFSGDQDFASRFYYRAVANQNRREWQAILPRLGSCRLYLVSGDTTYPKKVCMTRQIGMVIYAAQRFRSYRPFAGLFICDSHEGNAYLRQLEPPRHNEWNASRADDVPEAKRVLQNVRNWINQCLRELNPDEDARESDVPELNRYLPDEEEEPLADDSENARESGGEDGIVTAPVSQPLILQEVPPRPPASQPAPGGAAPEDGNEEGDGAGDVNPSPGDNETETPGGESETTGGGTTGEIQPHATKILLQTRSVRSGSDTYDLIVRSTGACAGRLNIVSVGEDNKEEPDLRITHVLDIGTGNEIGLNEFAIAAGQTTRLRVSIESTVPVSLRAYCYGN
jgi:hypothetical protein